VVARIAVRQQDRVAARAHRHLPLMCRAPLDVDQVDDAATGLPGEQRVAARGAGTLKKRQAPSAPAQCDPVVVVRTCPGGHVKPGKACLKRFNSHAARRPDRETFQHHRGEFAPTGADCDHTEQKPAD